MLIGALLALTACDGGALQPVSAVVKTTELSPSPPEPVAEGRQVRATGTIHAVRLLAVKVPRIAGISGQRGRLTLTHLIPNGSTVREGDLLAEFDRTPQLDAAWEAEAKYEDLGHQVEQKQAQNRSDSEKRLLELQRAEADLEKARIQLRKGPVLAEIERLKNETKAADAEARVASLRKSHQHRTRAEAAALRILELQRDRQTSGDPGSRCEEGEGQGGKGFSPDMFTVLFAIPRTVG